MFGHTVVGSVEKLYKECPSGLRRDSWFCGLLLKEASCSVMWDTSAELQVARYGIFSVG